MMARTLLDALEAPAPEIPRALAHAADSLHPIDAAMAGAEWAALVSGRMDVVDHFDEGGRRYVVAVRRPEQGRGAHKLSPREREVCARVARGESNKVVAYELGVAPSTVAAHLASATRKLGVRKRVELIRRWNAVPRDP